MNTQAKTGKRLLNWLAAVKTSLNLPVSRKAALLLVPGLIALGYPLFRQQIHRVTESGISPGASLGITELTGKVTDELAKREKDLITENKAALFEIKTFDLEISFVVTAKQSGGAEFNAKVLTTDDHVESGAENVQKITLHFAAIGPKSGHSSANLGSPPADPVDKTVQNRAARGEEREKK